LTADPVGQIKRLLEFLTVTASEDEITRSAAAISPRHTNAWENKLEEEDRKRVLPIIKPLLEQYGYWEQPVSPPDQTGTNI
jgi:hypothetical protein